MAAYDLVIFDNGAQAIVREREAVVSLKQLSEKLHKPLVRYIGLAKAVQGAPAGTLMHTVQLPAGTLLCYPGGEGNPGASAAEPRGIPSSEPPPLRCLAEGNPSRSDDEKKALKKYRLSRRRRAANETDI